MSNFSAAAKRHLLDSLLLQSRSRLANADHLAGIAAECGLKAILLHRGLLHPSANSAPTVSATGGKFGYHCPDAWNEYAALVGSYPSHSSLGLPSANPFAAPAWHINDRYEDGAGIDGNRVNSHLQGAQIVVNLLLNVESGNV